MSEDERLLAALVADRLEQGLAAQSWPASAGPTGRPSWLARVGSQVRDPSPTLHRDILDSLRDYAQYRRDQGIPADGFRAELGELVEQVEATVREAVLQRRDDWPAQAVLNVFGRLSSALREVACTAVEAYRDAERRRARSVAACSSELERAAAHEIRSRMQAVLLATKLLRDDGSGDEAGLHADNLDVIHAAVVQATGLLDDIRVLHVPDLAQDVDERRDVADVVAFVQREMGRMARKQRVRLDFDPPRGGGRVETLVAQLVLSNLVSNAIKYSDPDKPERWVRVRVQPLDADDAPALDFTVSDNGLGIPADARDRLFTSRFRANTDVAEGTGLGLVLCRTLVTERGGRVELVRSATGEGSVFRFTLPASGGHTPLSTADLAARAR